MALEESANQINNNNKRLLGDEFVLKSEEGKQLYSKLDSLANQFIQRDDQEVKIKIEKKSLILEMADICEQLHEKGEYLLPITSICSSVYKFVSRKGYDVSRSYVYDVIKENAPQYLNEKVDELTKELRKRTIDRYQNVQNRQIDTEILNQKVKDAIELLLNTSPNDIDSSIIQEYTTKIDQNIVGNWIDHSQKVGINLVSFNENEPTFDSKDNDQFREIIRTDKPEYRENDLGDQLMNLGDSHIELGKVLRRAGENANQFPFEENDPREQKFASKIKNSAAFNRLLVMVVKPMTDLKFKRSLIEWCDNIEKEEKNHGVHAASSKNPGEGWIKVINPETGKEEIIRVKRNLTREHIDDKVPEIRKIKALFRQYLPDYLDLNEWYVEKMKNWAIGQAYKLGPKLSDRKFK